MIPVGPTRIRFGPVTLIGPIISTTVAAMVVMFVLLLTTNSDHQSQKPKPNQKNYRFHS